ncbi:outer membrane beta-barrel protein [Enterovibrio norvegicus]|uniref:outer membrane beta-barrel protein n=1 Tax=Enterovibrio norvegicus TaxID=188144 RepID=UPI0015F2EA7E|nr:outer membrane beta-barrel protein [Enterovibrio norvegicus]
MNYKGSCLVTLSALPLSVAAVEPLAYQTENGIDVTPTVEMSAGHNDNVRRTTTDTVSSPMLKISPKVIALFQTDMGTYQFDYRLDAVSYSDSSEDSYADHQAHIGTVWMFDIRHRLRINYTYQSINEERGTGLTEGYSLSADEPLRFDYHQFNTRYTYGAAGAKGRLVGIAGYDAKAYDDVTFTTRSVQQSRYYNWKQPYVGGEFYYAVSNYFYAVAIGRIADRTYDEAAPNVISRDNTNSTLYGGLEWDITGKTQGKLLLGVQNKDFDDSGRETFQGFSWRANLSWRPAEYSELRLETRDYARDPDLNADYVKDRSVKVDWEHYWTPRLSTLATVRYGKNEYPGDIRVDDDTLAEVSATYSLARWWDVTVGASKFDRDSTFTGFSYDQTRFFLGMEVSL